MPFHIHSSARRILGTALIGAALAACSAPLTTVVTPPPAPAVTPSAGVPVITPLPPAATAAPAVATPSPAAQPIIGFEPKVGGPGTSVDVFGSGYRAGTHVVVRLGLPQPTGEVLASAVVDERGRWSARLVIPERLPSGDIITGGDMYLVTMDEENRALASAPFGFIRGAEPAARELPPR